MELAPSVLPASAGDIDRPQDSATARPVLDESEPAVHHDRDARVPVVVIPGIGGHPFFHENFLVSLSNSYAVHTAPHVDFFGDPCFDWQRHVDYWLGQVGRAARENAKCYRPPAIIGISFGAHVGNAVRARLQRPVAGPVILVSYWNLTAIERRALAALGTVPQMAATTIGTALFRWSELHTADRDRLMLLRNQLYDDEALVRRRLLARLVSLSVAPPVPPADATDTSFVFARREWALRRMRAQRGGTLPPRTALVGGDHTVSLRGSAELVNAVHQFIGSSRPPPPRARHDDGPGT